MITLENFEDAIDAVIVKRGKAYYQQGLVKYVELVSDSEYQVIVEGSEDYEVLIRVQKNKVISYACSCPYDFGPYCKHVVAVLYTLRHVKKAQNGKTEKSRTETIQEIVDKLSTEDLKQIIIKHAFGDRQFRVRLLRHYSSPTNHNPKKAYQWQIRACIRTAAGRRGFAEWHRATEAMEAAGEFLDQALDLKERQKWQEIVPIVQALLEELYPALQVVDDSNGDVGDILNGAWGLFKESVKAIDTTSKLAYELFDYCLSQADRDIYEGWSVQWDFYGVAVELVNSDDREMRLLEAIDKTAALENKQGKEYGSWHIDFTAEKAVEIKLYALEKRGKMEEAQTLKQKNINLPTIREKMIQSAFEKKEYSTVKQLAKDGITLAQEQELLGVERQFQKWLLAAAEKEQELGPVRHFLRLFFHDRHEFEYFDRLKKTYKNKDEWAEEVDTLISKLKKNTNNVGSRVS